jgi:hypothetical protein
MRLPLLALLLSGVPDAGTKPTPCTVVTLEYVNRTAASVRFLSFYAVDGTPHPVGQGKALAAGTAVTFLVPECIGPATKVRLSVEAFGLGGAQESTFLGAIGKAVRCRAVVEGGALSLSCRPE